MMRTLRLAAARLARISPLADATIFRFGAVGMFTTTLDVSLFTLIVSTTELPVAGANVISYCAGVCVSFLLNRNWTYSAAKTKGSGLRQAARFGTVYAVGATLSTLLVSFLASFIHETIAKLISVPIIFFWHYGATRLWAFQARPDAWQGRRSTRD